MKKTLIIIGSFLFLTSSVFADSFNVGISVGQGTLAASGTETPNSAGSASGGTAINQAERDGSATLPSIFIERQFDLPKDGLSITLGVDYIPVTGKIATLDGGTGTDAKVEAGKVWSIFSLSAKGESESFDAWF